MHLRIVPPPKKQNKTDSNKEDSSVECLDEIIRPEVQETESEKVEFHLNDDMKFVVLIVLMCFVPLSVYSYGASEWGHRIGTHLGFATGVICMWIGAYLLFVANWREHSQDGHSSD